MKLPTPPPAARRFASRPASPPRRVVVAPPAPFHAFIAYSDLPAAKRAIVAINQVIQATAGKFELRPMLWRFDQLARAAWCDHALADARAAGVVVLASGEAGALPLAVETWVTSLLARKRGERTTIVALQGGEEAWTISIEASAARPVSCALPRAA